MRLIWSVASSGIDQNLRGVTYGKGLFVAVGDKGTILTSSDGKAWSKQNTDFGQDLWGVTYSRAFDGFIAVGAWGTVLYSSDGKTWLRKKVNGADWLYGVVGDSRLVAVGARGLTITFGPSFNQPSSKRECNERLLGVVSHNTGALSVGEKGTILYSPDKKLWQKVASGVQANLWDVAKRIFDSTFIAVGESGTILLLSPSENGIEWNEGEHAEWEIKAVSSGSGPNLFGVVHAYYQDSSSGLIQNMGMFIAVGEKGTIILSEDGLNWDQVHSATQETLWGIAYGYDSGLVVAVGENGTILNGARSD